MIRLGSKELEENGIKFEKEYNENRIRLLQKKPIKKVFRRSKLLNIIFQDIFDLNLEMYQLENKIHLPFL